MQIANSFGPAVNPILVEIVRGEMVESVHRGAVAIADRFGRIVASAGAVEEVVYPRSALKPIQAIPLIESGALDHFGLGAREIALACASHEGEPLHVEIVDRWLKRIGLSASDLRCGVPEPRCSASEGEACPCTAAAHQCSGNHAGFLTTARFFGESTSEYVLPDHPAQARVYAVLGELAAIDVARAPKGTDGCGIPVIGIPLKSLATAMARLGDPVDLPKSLGAAATRIVAAMYQEPYLVAGGGRACTALMQAAKQRLIVKMGAEGVYVAAIPHLGLGIAIKIDDGARRAAEVAVATALCCLGVLNGGEVSAIGPRLVLRTSARSDESLASSLDFPVGVGEPIVWSVTSSMRS